MEAGGVFSVVIVCYAKWTGRCSICLAKWSKTFRKQWHTDLLKPHLSAQHSTESEDSAALKVACVENSGQAKVHGPVLKHVKTIQNQQETPELDG